MSKDYVMQLEATIENLRRDNSILKEENTKYKDLEEQIGVNNLIAFLEWCVKFRNNFINRSFDDMVAFYKRAMCETEKRSE